MKKAISLALASLAVTIAAHAQMPAPDVTPFDDQPHPAAPDYSVPASWAAIGQLPGPSASTPAGAFTSGQAKDVDVFYIHPTTYRTSEFWNQDIADDDLNHWTDVSVVARQSSVFNDCCRVFTPRYRQASFLATSDLTLTADGGKAYGLAYSDVERAFDYYLEHFNNGRPFIIAGHSQGALHTYRLLRDRIDPSPLADQLVAGYIIGLDLMEGDFGRTFKTLPLCKKPTQTGCILAWNAMLKGADTSMYRKFGGTRYAHAYGTDEGRAPVCINPITFDVDKPNASPAQHKGAVPGAPGEGPLRDMVANKIEAHCDAGLLIVDVPADLDLTPIPGGSMHYHEFGMFYQDIRVNIHDRIEAFQSAP